MISSSWSDTLFLRMNSVLGRSRHLDRLILFCGHDLLYVLGFSALLWATNGLFDRDPLLLELYLKLLMTAGVFGFGVSFLLGIFFPHARPFTEYPAIPRLFEPMGAWKSFPSDHTIASFTIAFVTAFLGAPLWVVVGLFVMAAAVALGRVFAGVHYPRDILGGFFVALFVSLLSFWLLATITQPLYTFFRTLI